MNSFGAWKFSSSRWNSDQVSPSSQAHEREGWYTTTDIAEQTSQVQPLCGPWCALRWTRSHVCSGLGAPNEVGVHPSFALDVGSAALGEFVVPIDL